MVSRVHCSRCAPCSSASGSWSLNTAEHPFRSVTWAAAMTVICERDSGDLDRTQRLGGARFEQAVRRRITRRGGQKPSPRILRRLFSALADCTGVIAHRPDAMERIALLLQDWRAATGKLTDTEARMVAVLDEFELTGVVTSITDCPRRCRGDPGRDRGRSRGRLGAPRRFSAGDARG